jgi:islet cell auto antigen 1
MYSHVLAAYQKTLLVFWAKTSKTMSAVAESFKGYQYYEFTVIKDLVEPSRLLAEMNSSSFTEKSKGESRKTKKTNSEEPKTDDTLIDLTQSEEQTTRSSTITGNGN